MATPKAQPTPALSNLKNINSARIDRLFARLGAIYGYVWHSQFKSEGFLDLAKEEWEDGLRKIDDKNIQLAIDACKREYPMPLSLPAFYQLCRRYQPEKPWNVFIPYEDRRAKPETAEKYLKKMKEIVSSIIIKA